MVQVLRKLPNSVGPQRLLLFHHAGGSGAQYYASLKSWASRYEIYCLDLPGRFFRQNEMPFKNLQELLQAIKLQISTLPPLPTFLLGHSFGALLSYELAWLFNQDPSFSIVGLGLSALRPPSAETLLNHQKLSLLNDGELLQAVEKFSALPAVVKREPAFLNLTLNALRNDFALMASYRLRAPLQKLPLPSLVFGGAADANVPLKELEGWNSLVSTKKNPLIFSGDHFYIFTQMDKLLHELFALA